MTLLVCGLVLFFAVHLIPTLGLRPAFVGRVGELPYKGLFAMLALAGLVLIVMGKSEAAFVPVWHPPAFMGHITKLLMLPAFILLLAAYIPSNIKRRIRHPMLLATKLWATGHLLINGDLASMLLFGSFLAFAVVAMISANKRGEAPELSVRPRYMDVLVVALGFVVYAAVAMHHLQLFGVALF